MNGTFGPSPDTHAMSLAAPPHSLLPTLATARTFSQPSRFVREAAPAMPQEAWVLEQRQLAALGFEVLGSAQPHAIWMTERKRRDGF